jgi:hypothetical protein
MNNPFEVVVDYTVKMDLEGSFQRFVLFRCGFGLILHVAHPNHKVIHFIEVEVSPEAFLKSIKEQEEECLECAETFHEVPRWSEGFVVDWAAWWDGIAFDYADIEEHGVMSVSDFLINQINKKD